MASIKVFDQDSQSYRKLPLFRGQSAYECARECGFTGTQEEWVETIALGHPITERVRGLALQMHDTADAPIAGITIYGKSEQIFEENDPPSISNHVSIENVGTPIVGGEHDGKYAVTIRSRGKNLFNKAESAVTTIREETAGEYWGTSIFPTGYDLSKVFPLSTQVTVSYDIICTEHPNYTYEIQSGDGSTIGMLFWNGSVIADLRDWKTLRAGNILHLSFTFTVPADLTGARLIMYTNRYKKGEEIKSCKAIFANIQVETSDHETEYTPWVEPSEVTVYLDEPLYGIKGLRNEVVINGDGTGYILKKTNRKIFNGTEAWHDEVKNGRHCFWSTIADAPSASANYKFLCNYAEYGEYAGISNWTQNACLGSAVIYLVSGCSTVAEHQAWVAQKYNEGKPLTVLYQIELPYKIPIPTEQVRELLRLRTFFPTTDIVAGGTEIAVEYITDPKNYMQKMLDLLFEAIVIAGGTNNA